MGRLYEITNQSDKRRGYLEEGRMGHTFLAKNETKRLTLPYGEARAAQRDADAGHILLDLVDDRGPEEAPAAIEAPAAAPDATPAKADPPTRARIITDVNGQIAGAQLLDGGTETVTVENAADFVLMVAGESTTIQPFTIDTSGSLLLRVDLGEGKGVGEVQLVTDDDGVVTGFFVGDAEFTTAELFGGLVEDVSQNGGQESPPPPPPPADENPMKSYSDDQLREIIENKTGKAPHPNAKRDTLEKKAAEALGLDAKKAEEAI